MHCCTFSEDTGVCTFLQQKNGRENLNSGGFEENLSENYASTLSPANGGEPANGNVQHEAPPLVSAYRIQHKCLAVEDNAKSAVNSWLRRRCCCPLLLLFDGTVHCVVLAC